MFKKIAIILAFVILVCIGMAEGQAIVDKKAGVTVAWDHDGVGVNHYEVRIIRDVSLTESNYATTGTTLIIPRPKSGIYVVMVRAVGPDGQSSDWCVSTQVCASPSPWKVRWRPSGTVGPIIIGKGE